MLTDCIRIEHGQRKGLKINDGFSEKGSRITTSSNRCVLYNVLRNKLYINFDGLKCLDLCCGSGIVGFELLSLGCQSCTFVDCNKKRLKEVALAINKHNFNAETVSAFLPHLFVEQNTKFDIIFLDPPYENDFCQKTVDMIFQKQLLSENGYLIVETLDDINCNNFEVVDIKYLKNKAKFYFLKIN